MGEIAHPVENVAVLANTMNEPPVDRSSKQIRRSYCLGGNGVAGGARHLDALGIARPAILQYPPHGDAERIFVDAGPLAVAADAQQLGAFRFSGAATGEPGPAFRRNLGGDGKSFDVVDHGRLVQIAVGGRERRTDARHAVLAFQRFDQRRFFAADVSARAEMNVDVEIKTRLTQDVLAQQTDLAPALQVWP
jgi:hypothetical protein